MALEEETDVFDGIPYVNREMRLEVKTRGSPASATPKFGTAWAARTSLVVRTPSVCRGVVQTAMLESDALEITMRPSFRPSAPVGPTRSLQARYARLGAGFGLAGYAGSTAMARVGKVDIRIAARES